MATVTDRATQVPGESHDDVTVEIKVRDNGPYKVTGPVRLIDAEGNAFDVPDGPIALCRCGKSQTKPFCDKAHRTGFESCPRAART